MSNATCFISSINDLLIQSQNGLKTLPRPLLLVPKSAPLLGETVTPTSPVSVRTYPIYSKQFLPSSVVLYFVSSTSFASDGNSMKIPKAHIITPWLLSRHFCTIQHFCCHRSSDSHYPESPVLWAVIFARFDHDAVFISAFHSRDGWPFWRWWAETFLTRRRHCPLWPPWIRLLYGPDWVVDHQQHELGINHWTKQCLQGLWSDFPLDPTHTSSQEDRFTTYLSKGLLQSFSLQQG